VKPAGQWKVSHKTKRVGFQPNAINAERRKN